MVHISRRAFMVLACLAVIPACGGGGSRGSAPPLAFSWAAAQLVESDDVAGASSPRVVIAPDGTATVVWLQSDGTRDNLWARRFVPGTGWGTAQLIESSGDGASVARLGVDSSGNVMALWEMIDGSQNSIWWNRYVAGSGWGTAQVLESSAESATSAALSVGANGAAVAAWTQDDGTRSNLWARAFTPLGGWAAPVLVESSTESASSPALAVDADGNATAVWTQFDGARHNLWGSRFTPLGGWNGPTLVETSNSGSASQQVVVVDSNGIATTLWSQFDGAQINLWSNRHVPLTGWGTPEIVKADVPLPYHQAAVDPAGNVTVAWGQADVAGSSLWANRYVPGTGWGPGGAIETDNTGGVYLAEIAADAAGNVVVVWVQTEATGLNVRANHFVPGVGWGTPQLLETAAGDVTTYYDVAMDPQGRALAVWPQSDGTRFNIWGARFE